MADVSVIIPVGPGHEDLARRAEMSARNQTTPVEIVVMVDRDGKGAGWARNRAIERVTTPYILFLDADDYLAPAAVEKLWAAIQKHPGRYAYSDYYQGQRPIRVSTCCWCLHDTVAHLISALLPTEWARAIGGFDESLPALEDRDFWMRLRHHLGKSGVRVPEPLLHYTADGYRSRQVIGGVRHGHAIINGAGKALRARIAAKFEGMEDMACCIKRNTVATTLVGAQPGDVKAIALWSGNRTVMGAVSGRKYFGGNRHIIKGGVDPRDAAQQKRLFRVVS